MLSVRLGLHTMLRSTFSRCRHGLRLLLDRDGRGGLETRVVRLPGSAASSCAPSSSSIATADAAAVQPAREPDEQSVRLSALSHR